MTDSANHKTVDAPVAAGTLEEQRARLLDALRAIAGVTDHDTRFVQEVALVAPTSAKQAVLDCLQGQLGPAKKGATDPRPDALAAMAARFGGLRGGQTLFASPSGDHGTLYVALWPWGSGQRFTIKVGIDQEP